MPEIMLCGARDAGEVSQAFSEVVQDFGAVPWFYQDGRILHINSKTSSWSENSRATVKRVDICVFVILDHYGEITWNEELKEALEVGKPFVVLALESAWTRYSTLLHTISDPDAIRSKDDQKMVDVLRTISDYQFTVVSFSHHTFQQKLRHSLSYLMEKGLKLLQTRNQRQALLESLTGKERLSRRQIDQLISLAADEYHDDKYERKTAIKRLAAEEVRDNEFILDICNSAEQGVQRLAFDLIPSLVRLPLEDDLLRELAQIAARNDDIGVARRLTISLSKLHPSKMDILLEEMENLEEGVRRRAFEGIESHWNDIVDEWGAERMRRFLSLCEAKSSTRASWLERLRKQRDDLM